MEKKKGVILSPDFFTQKKSTPKETPSPVPSEQKNPTTKADNVTGEHEPDSTQNKKATAVEEKPIAAPKPPKINIAVPVQGKRVSGLSLSSIIKKKEWDKVQKKEVKKEDLPNEAFTQEKLMEKIPGVTLTSELI